MLNMCASKRIMSTKDGCSGNFNIYFINTSWFWWLDVLNAIGCHVVDSPGLGLLDLVLVELHRLPRTWRRRPLRWRLQNRFGDGEFRRRRCRWRRLFCSEELVHETCFAIFDDALLWWHRRCWRSKRGTGKHKNQLFLSCNIILQTKKLDVAKKTFRAIIFWTWINWTEASGDVAWFTVLGDWRSLLSWAYSRLLIDFLLQKSHFKKVDSIFVENMWIYQNAWFEYL